MRTRVATTPKAVFLLLMFAFAVFPIFGIALIAFQTGHSFGAGQVSFGSFTLSNLRDAWNRGEFSRSLLSSGIVIIGVLPAASFLSILAGFAFSTFRFPGKALLYVVFLFGMMVPLEAMIIPLYYSFRQAGLTDSYAALILPQIGLHIPFGVFWMRSTFEALPRDLTDAARVDGVGDWNLLWRILVPIARPAIGTMLALQFLWVWNEFLLPLVMIRSDHLRTATLSISVFRGQYSDNLPLLAAACLIVAGPVILAYALFQRGFINGVAAGAMKD